ncbi:MAG TPA: amidohydrolase [Vicinamibacterales bacterium]|nr:amidohydrolase [Vicinamibacterales bacterium]
MSARTRLLPILLLVSLSPAPAAAQLSDATKQALDRVSAIEPKVVAWRRDIHQHPELGNREKRTAALVADHLRALGLEVATGVAHTGVVGLLRGGRPGPVVLLRADMDALPVTERVDVPFASKVKAEYMGETVGVMHACGHDAHTAILMGAAEILAGMRDQIPGTIKFIFQPAEEGAPLGEQGGAGLMVKEGILKNPDVDAAFALHVDAKKPIGHIYYNSGATYASSDDFRIVVKGRQTHGAAPWNGIDPVVISAHIITALQTIVSRQMNLSERAVIVTVGKVRAGNRSNIIPEEAELVGTLRALHPDDRQALQDKLRRTVTNVAESMGATVEITVPYTHGYPVTMNDEALTKRMVPVLEAVAGRDFVHERRPRTGAEDFSFIAQEVPGFYFNIGARRPDVKEEDAADHHTPDFFVDERGLAVGVKAMVAMALEYLAAHATSQVTE